jgi:hypothetical protein
MEQYKVDARKVAGVIREANTALVGKGFGTPEVVLGLSELLGRIVVEASDNTLIAKDYMKIIEQHVSLTINTLVRAKQKNIAPLG